MKRKDIAIGDRLLYTAPKVCGRRFRYPVEVIGFSDSGRPVVKRLNKPDWCHVELTRSVPARRLSIIDGGGASSDQS